MYQDYKNVAEFRMVYINEAHAADGRRPVAYAKEKGITEHDDYEERCTTAQMLLDDKTLTIPCLIDGMDNKVNEAYSAWPDRIFLIRTDGKLAVAAARGPRGFKPGLDAANGWLKQFSESGKEPELSAVKDKTDSDAAGKGSNLNRPRKRNQKNDPGDGGDP
jgi:hypothetical protein